MNSAHVYPGPSAMRPVNFLASLLIVLASLLSMQAVAQIPQSPNKLDKNGQRDGAWTIIADDDFAPVADASKCTCYAVISYLEGKPVGRTTYRYTSGEVRWEGELTQVAPFVPLDGQHVCFHKNGKKERTFEFKGGRMEGVVTGWYESGKKKYEISMSGGSREGKSVEWYEHGQKWNEMPYRNGKKEGMSFIWYKNGQKWSETPYKNDVREGLSTSWYPSGQKELETPYVADKVCS